MYSPESLKSISFQNKPANYFFSIAPKNKIMLIKSKDNPGLASSMHGFQSAMFICG